MGWNAMTDLQNHVGMRDEVFDGVEAGVDARRVRERGRHPQEDQARPGARARVVDAAYQLER